MKGWRKQGLDFVKALAKKQRFLCSDDLWDAGATDFLPDVRSMAQLIGFANHARLIRKVDGITVLTGRPDARGRQISVWESNFMQAHCQGLPGKSSRPAMLYEYQEKHDKESRRRLAEWKEKAEKEAKEALRISDARALREGLAEWEAQELLKQETLDLNLAGEAVEVDQAEVVDEENNFMQVNLATQADPQAAPSIRVPSNLREFLLHFEGKKIRAIDYKGLNLILARDQGMAIGYENNGRRFVQQITGEWADELKHKVVILPHAVWSTYSILNGENSGCSDSEQPESVNGGHRGDMVFLTPEGVLTACMLTRKAAGRSLRKWASEEVFPSVFATGSYAVPGASLPPAAPVVPVALLEDPVAKARMDALEEGQKKLEAVQKNLWDTQEKLSEDHEQRKIVVAEVLGKLDRALASRPLDLVIRNHRPKPVTPGQMDIVWDAAAGCLPPAAVTIPAIAAWCWPLLRSWERLNQGAMMMARDLATLSIRGKLHLENDDRPDGIPQVSLGMRLTAILDLQIGPYLVRRVGRTYTMTITKPAKAKKARVQTEKQE